MTSVVEVRSLEGSYWCHRSGAADLYRCAMASLGKELGSANISRDK